LKIQARLVFIL